MLSLPTGRLCVVLLPTGTIRRSEWSEVVVLEFWRFFATNDAARWFSGSLGRVMARSVNDIDLKTLIKPVEDNSSANDESGSLTMLADNGEPAHILNFHFFNGFVDWPIVQNVP